MSNDLISRSALLEKECCGRISGNDVRNAPAVDAEPVRHGEWIIKSELIPIGFDPGEYDVEFFGVCSECGRMIPVDIPPFEDECCEKINAEYPYCHCGAKMNAEVQE